jgi:Fe-S oxidoreductase
VGYDYAKYFGEIRTLHDLMTRPEDRTWRLAPPGRDPEPHRVVLYLGCNVLRTSHLVQTVCAIFDRLGVDYVAVGGVTYCCGIQHHNHGDTAAAQGVSRRTVEHFSKYRPEEVVMWCPSCIHFYDEVQHMQLPFRVRHPSEFLVERLPELTFTTRADRAVALHGHAVGEARRREAAAGRALLEAVPGLTFVDVGLEERFGRTCAPAVREALGPQWDDLVRAQLARAHAAGAATLATIYHGCQRMMCAFEPEQPVLVEHYLTVFGRALGIEFEDTFKKYKHWNDPERVLAEMTPCQQVNGVDPARARAVVKATFS